MNITGPIIIIEEDNYETDILREVISDLGYNNTVIGIDNPCKAIDFLRSSEKPFMVLSAINMKGINGLQLRDEILKEQELSRKCAPFIFYSAYATEDTCREVFNRQANGFIHGINDYVHLQQSIEVILKYWKMSSIVA